MVESFLSDNMGIHNVTSMSGLWNLPPPKSEVEMDNLWALIQSNEYVYSQMFETYDVFPGRME